MPLPTRHGTLLGLWFLTMGRMASFSRALQSSLLPTRNTTRSSSRRIRVHTAYLPHRGSSLRAQAKFPPSSQRPCIWHFTLWSRTKYVTTSARVLSPWWKPFSREQKRTLPTDTVSSASAMSVASITLWHAPSGLNSGAGAQVTFFH